MLSCQLKHCYLACPHRSVARAIPPEDREDQEGSFFVFRRIAEEEVRGWACSPSR